MKIHSAETVTRYHVTFTAAESVVLAARSRWGGELSFDDNGYAHGRLTSKQLATLCEDIGIDRIYAHPTTLGVLPISNGPEYADIIEYIRKITGTRQP